MGDFLDQVYFNNTLRSYFLVAGTILLAILIKRILSRYIAGVLFALVKRVARGVDKKSFVRLVVSPLEVFLLMLISIIAFDKLDYPIFGGADIGKTPILYKNTLQEFVKSLSVIILIITFIWLMLRILEFIALILQQKSDQKPDPADNQLIVFFKDFFKVIVVIFGILLILKFAFHYPISNLLTGLSIATAAIALSTRESLENLIASFIIFFDKPFMVGDQVKVQEITGTVERIGLRSTRIRTDQKTYVTVPNKQMVDSITDNLSLRTQRRAFVLLELHSETSHDAVNRLIQRIQNILKEKELIESHTVFLSDINKNAFLIHTEFFTAPIPAAEFNAIRQQVNLSIIELMEEMNVRLASKEDAVSPSIIK
jgi:MscS family membrane protein